MKGGDSCKVPCPKVFKRLFPPALFATFIDVGHYKQDVALYRARSSPAPRYHLVIPTIFMYHIMVFHTKWMTRAV